MTDSLRHGTRNTYQYHDCRCPECTEANRQGVRLFKERHAGEQPYRHGRSGYTNWGCRCDVCSLAHSTYCRARYLLTKKTSETGVSPA